MVINNVIHIETVNIIVNKAYLKPTKNFIGKPIYSQPMLMSPIKATLSLCDLYFINTHLF